MNLSHNDQTPMGVQDHEEPWRSTIGLLVKSTTTKGTEKIEGMCQRAGQNFKEI